MSETHVNRTTLLVRAIKRIQKWLEPELFQPFLFGIFLSLTLSEFVRGALTLSVLPTYGRTILGFAVEYTALALSIHFLIDNLLRAPAGWLTDKLGQRPVLLAGFALSTTAVFWMMHVHSISTLIASVALFGVGVSPMWPATISGISRATPKAHRASFMGYMYIFWLLGTGLGPVLINFIVGRTYDVAFWVLLGVDALGFALTFALVRKPRAIRYIDESVNTTRAANEPSVHETKTTSRLKSGTDWSSLWRNIREVAFLFPGMFAQTFAVASLVPILSLYAKIVLGLSGALYSSVLVAGGACTVLLLLPAGKAVDRFGPRRFLVSAFLLTGTAIGVFPLFHTLTMTFVVVAVLGMAYAFILPAWNSVLDNAIDADKKATLWGVFMTVEGIGSAVGPYLGGLLWDRVNPSAPFLVSGGVIVTMGVLYTMLPINRKRAWPDERIESAPRVTRRGRRGEAR